MNETTLVESEIRQLDYTGWVNIWQYSGSPRHRGYGVWKTDKEAIRQAQEYIRNCGEASYIATIPLDEWVE
jgi:hypothetical protein